MRATTCSSFIITWLTTWKQVFLTITYKTHVRLYTFYYSCFFFVCYIIVNRHMLFIYFNAYMTKKKTKGIWCGRCFHTYITNISWKRNNNSNLIHVVIGGICLHNVHKSLKNKKKNVIQPTVKDFFVSFCLYICMRMYFH